MERETPKTAAVQPRAASAASATYPLCRILPRLAIVSAPTTDPMPERDKNIAYVPGPWRKITLAKIGRKVRIGMNRNVMAKARMISPARSEEHTSELQSLRHLV